MALCAITILNTQDSLAKENGSGNLLHIWCKRFKENFIRVIIWIFEIPRDDILGDELLIKIVTVTLLEALEKLENIMLTDFSCIVEWENIEKHFLV